MLVPGKIALIFFSRSSVCEAKHKRLLPSVSTTKNQKLTSVLIQQTLKTLENAPFDVVHFNEYNQSGGSFGEKIANAFSEVFNQGYAAAICVGNDTPQLAEVDWFAVESALRNGQNVLGPNHRNGAYLIGIAKDSFDANAFSKLRWQTANIYQDLFRHCENSYVLKPLHDLNLWADLIAVFPVLKAFKKFIYSLIQGVFRVIDLPKSPQLVVVRFKSLRAPPSF